MPIHLRLFGAFFTTADGLLLPGTTSRSDRCIESKKQNKALTGGPASVSPIDKHSGFLILFFSGTFTVSQQRRCIALHVCLDV